VCSDGSISISKWRTECTLSLANAYRETRARLCRLGFTWERKRRNDNDADDGNSSAPNSRELTRPRTASHPHRPHTYSCIRYIGCTGERAIVVQFQHGGKLQHRKVVRESKFKFRHDLIKSLNWLSANRGATSVLHFTRVPGFHSLCEFPSGFSHEVHRSAERCETVKHPEHEMDRRSAFLLQLRLQSWRNVMQRWQAKCVI